MEKEVTKDIVPQISNYFKDIIKVGKLENRLYYVNEAILNDVLKYKTDHNLSNGNDAFMRLLKKDLIAEGWSNDRNDQFRS
jgi:hypothetical protein